MLPASRRLLTKKAARRLTAQQRAMRAKRLATKSRLILDDKSADDDDDDYHDDEFNNDYDSFSARNSAIRNFRPNEAGVVQPVEQNFRYFLVLDFEATCDHKSNGPFGPTEIIEFPALKVCARTFHVQSQFHTFVRPTVNQILKPFCTQLTGMVQDDIDRASTLPQTLRNFHEWLLDEELLSSLSSSSNDKIGGKDEGESESVAKSNFAVVTCGDWDLGKALPNECARLGIPTPPYLKSWINVKLSFSNSHGKWARGMQHMLDELKLPLLGRPHSGIDDCYNVANILKALAQQKRCAFRITSALKETEKDEDAVSRSLKSFHSQ